MDAGRVLREARRRAGLTQRQLAEKVGIAQPAVARIERGAVVPRVDTLDRLLQACGEGLYARPRLGVGVDRSLIRLARAADPSARSRAAEEEAPYLAHGRKAERPLRRWDPVRAIGCLLEHGVRFVVIGGYAARLHGSPSVTNDTDICYERTSENMQRLAEALNELRSKLRGAPEGLPSALDATTLGLGMNFTFDTEAGSFDCLGLPAGIDSFDELERNAVEFEVEGVVFLAASVSDLIRMKIAAGRPKDRVEVEILGALQEEIDRDARGERE